MGELEETRQIAKKARNGSAMLMASLGTGKVQGLTIDQREVGNVGAFDGSYTRSACDSCVKLVFSSPECESDFCSAWSTILLDLGFVGTSSSPAKPGLDRSGSAFMWVVELRRGYVFLTIDDATMWMAPSPLMASEACPWRMSYLIRIGGERHGISQGQDGRRQRSATSVYESRARISPSIK